MPGTFQMTESDFYIENYSEIDKEENNYENETEDNRLEQNLPCPTLTEPSDELTKKKSPEVGHVDQNKTVIEVDNPKELNCTRLPKKLIIVCHLCRLILGRQCSPCLLKPPYQDLDSEILDSSMDNDEEIDVEEPIIDNYHFDQGCFELIFGKPFDLQSVDDETQISSKDTRDLITYGFFEL